MNNYDFYAVLLSNEALYIGLLIATAFLHFLIFRKFIITIFDPYLLPIIFSIFGISTVTFLFLTKDVSLHTFLSFALSQAAFYCGLFFFKPVKYMIRRKIRENDSATPTDIRDGHRNYKLIFFYTSSFILLTSQVTVYFLKGIPLLMESRLETFAGSGGVGILGRIIDVSTVCSLYSFFSVVHFDFPRKSEIFKYFVITLVLITLLLSGSKSGFFFIIYTFWTYIFFSVLKGGDYSMHLRALKSNMKLIIITSILLAMGIIYMQATSDAGSFFLLALRFVHSADVYWYAYPNNLYLSINDDHPFRALFNDLLGMLRIYRWDDLPQAIGITLKNIHHPSNILQGPNARHNVFGLVYFGYVGGIIFSLCLGMISSFVRNVLPRILKRNLVSGVVLSFLLIKTANIDADPMLWFSYLDNLIFIFPLVLIIVGGVSTALLKRYSNDISGS